MHVVLSGGDRKDLLTCVQRDLSGDAGGWLSARSCTVGERGRSSSRPVFCLLRRRIGAAGQSAHNKGGATVTYARDPCSEIEPSVVCARREPPGGSPVYRVRGPLQLLAVDGHVEACQHDIDRVGNGDMVAAGEQQTHGLTVVRAFCTEHDEGAGITAS
jgi:hypothetical protein